jgi:hypothetical protein
MRANPPGLKTSLSLGFWEVKMALLPVGLGGGTNAAINNGDASADSGRLIGNRVEVIEGRGVLVSFEQFEEFSKMAEQLERGNTLYTFSPLL